ncbi:MAG: hypothetical protein OEU32_03480 [Acidimicrobiia bacterium]|nr:hypothetical protein [Acidimicrobiia bacterium]
MTATTVRFTEEMEGHIALGEIDPRTGAAAGRERGAHFKFHLTIETIDIERFVSEPEHLGHATGWIDSDELGGRLAVEAGDFNLFVDTDEPGVKEMRYVLWFSDSVGHPLTMTGTKYVADDRGLDMWSDTTTLFCRVHQGHVRREDDAPVVGAGMLRIRPISFARQLTTFRASGGSVRDRLQGISRFAALFVGRLRDVYGPRGAR